MEFNDSIKKAVDIIKLDEKAIEKVSKDTDAWKLGLIIIAIGGILGGIASYIMSNIFLRMINFPMQQEIRAVSASEIITSPIGSIIGTFIIVGIIFLFVKLFKGKAGYMEHFTPIAFASILSWLTILNLIPVLGWLINFLAGIWAIIVTIVIVRKVNSFTTGKAAAVVLIPLAILFILAALLAAIAFISLGTTAGANLF